ncbi:hypothetical protein N7462_010854 [Penicillium macrosclerotiorum]|uniref:uncharacterized protein n=1 Tax=Penicillium macrosclerotiorum TaxID=303699 RepID=UPI0025467758|nr:uncharacterized protein N7462_010854 [Penicillium macrosclerotiorum]KAJ5669784.1 hypothetical protein N7462_010854 [Penicillium macrosclerotiorum]
MLAFFVVLLCLVLHSSAAQRHDTDLWSFFTLPEVRALKFEVTHLDRERQLPGYWFVAPYGQIDPENPTKKYQEFQIGPYIYDNEGMLIWAGSPMTDNRNVFDFKANWNIDDKPRLSFILQHAFDNSNKGSGVILDQHYEIEHQVGVTNDVDAFNMHEFNIMDGGQTALACTYRSQEINLADLDRPDENSWMITGGFVELDIKTGEILAEWDSTDHIAVHESIRFHAWNSPSGFPGVDYVHINSVDKNAAGDYIISLRFTNTIYLISGEDGHIIWRLGGSESDFQQDFQFSKQHDIKFVDSNSTHHTISFLNNASDESENEEDFSTAFFIELDTTVTPMTATTIKRIERPDHGLTRLRGNVQPLQNGNTFVGWSERGYHSEHAPNGDLLMYARFASTRFSSYRSYKFDWIGQPTTPPDVVAFAYGTSDTDLLTVIHVSWNGATDVAQWGFYAQATEDSDPVFIGYANKTNFETMHIVEGYMDWISATAFDRDGNVLRTSRVQRTEVPPDWKAVGFDEESSGPHPNDPSLLQGHREHIDSSPSDGASMVNNGLSGSEYQSATRYTAMKEVAKAVYLAYSVLSMLKGVFIVILLLCGIAGIVACFWWVIRRQKRRSYQQVPASANQPPEEIPLRSSMDV